jgi:hypothetical protein
MTSQGIQPKFLPQTIRSAIALLCVASLAPGPQVALGQAPQAPQEPAATPTTTDEVPAPKIPNEELDSLVAPIALYPDPLLSQTLVASTYPLELIQLQQWLERNKTLKGQALADAVQKQPWDPSVQAMVAFPDVVQRTAGNIQWTTELGNAFLAQQDDVFAAVQRMRAKAQGTGSLKTSAQQKVETQAVEGGQEVIVIQQADPKVVYVPSYDPVVVYGAPAYPYPSYTYPGYIAGAALTFGAGLALGAAWGGGWGYNCGWGGHGNNNVTINNSNTFVNNANRTANISGGNRANIGNQVGSGNNKWQHNPAHRGGAPYGDRGTANKFGGRGPGQRPGGVGGVGSAGNRPGGVGGIGSAGNRPGGVGGAGGIGSAGNRPGGVGGAGGIGSAGNRPGGVGGAGAGRPSTLPASRPSGGSSIGNRSVSPGAGAGSNKSAFSGGGSSGGAARASSSRGASSMGGAKAGGAARPSAGARPSGGGGGGARPSGGGGGSRGGGGGGGGGGRGGGRR